jgi:hypothetical protein
MAFVVEIVLVKARKSDSNIQIKDKQDLFHALTDRNTFTKILQQADDILKSQRNFWGESQTRQLLYRGLFYETQELPRSE